MPGLGLGFPPSIAGRVRSMSGGVGSGGNSCISMLTHSHTSKSMPMHVFAWLCTHLHALICMPSHANVLHIHAYPLQYVNACKQQWGHWRPSQPPPPAPPKPNATPHLHASTEVGSVPVPGGAGGGGKTPEHMARIINDLGETHAQEYPRPFGPALGKAACAPWDRVGPEPLSPTNACRSHTKDSFIIDLPQT